MPHLNNIIHIRINAVSGNGVVNMGNAVLEGFSANAEGVGGQTIVGDEIASPATIDYSFNFFNDPDIVDQQQKTL